MVSIEIKRMPPYTSDIKKINVDGTGDMVIIAHGDINSEPDVSRDGKYVTYMHEENCCWTGFRSIRLYDLTTSSFTEIMPNDDMSDFSPRFSPNGNHIIWSRNRDTDPYGFGFDIWRMNSDGTSLLNLTGGYTNLEFSYPAFLPDGSQIVVNARMNGGNADIYVMNADGTGLTQLTSDTSEELMPDVITIVNKAPSGQSKIGIHRNGIWALDNNGDGIFNWPGDKVYWFGGPGDVPVTGNW